MEPMGVPASPEMSGIVTLESSFSRIGIPTLTTVGCLKR